MNFLAPMAIEKIKILLAILELPSKAKLFIEANLIVIIFTYLRY